MDLRGLVAHACAERGLLPPDSPMTPGVTCRVDDAAKGYGGDGWLWIHLDGCGLHAQNWRQDDKPEIYRLEGAPDAHPLLRAAAKAQQSARRVMASEAAAECARVWNAATPADPAHPYLIRKGVPYAAGELRQIATAPTHLGRKHAALVPPVLVVPGYREGELKPTALTYIDAQGTKLWHPHCAIDGQFGVMHSAAWNAPGAVYIAEGIATAASVAAATQRPCCYCFDAGNLPKAARRIRALRPADELVVCADDDWRLPKNKGVIKAREAAAAVGARFVAPNFAGIARSERDSDFNDLARLTGPDALAARLTAAPPTLAALPHEQLLVQDLWACRDQGKYYHGPSRKFLSAETVDKSIGPKTSSRLMQTQAVSDTIWAPGEVALVTGKRLLSGGWESDSSAVSLNLYRAPTLEDGNPMLAERWVDHVRRVWPKDCEHIVMWMAHRTQRPGEKINHALVLGGAQGVGKDTALQPLVAAVGPENYREVSPREIATSQFNPYVKAVVLRVNEARDLGEAGRFAFYDQMKVMCAAPPDTLVINDKHMRAISVLNVVGVIYTTNYRTGGMHLAPDDRRHYVAWSETDPRVVDTEALAELWRWFAWENGYRHVTAYLRGFDISSFDAKGPPPKTEAFWSMVESSRGLEVDEIADCVHEMGGPAVVTADQVAAYGSAHGKEALKAWLGKPENRRHLPRRLEECGYEYYRNPDTKDGRWKVGGSWARCYARRGASWQELTQALAALREGAVIRRSGGNS